MKRFHHLSEEKIIKSVIDEKDLSPSEKKHLLECETCSMEKEELLHMLGKLGTLSRELLPVERVCEKKIRRPKKQHFLSPLLTPRFAFASIFILFFSWSTILFISQPGIDPLTNHINFHDENGIILSEIDDFIEQPIPTYYLEMIVDDEQGEFYDEYIESATFIDGHKTNNLYKNNV